MSHEKQIDLLCRIVALLIRRLLAETGRQPEEHSC